MARRSDTNVSYNSPRMDRLRWYVSFDLLGETSKRRKMIKGEKQREGDPYVLMSTYVRIFTFRLKLRKD